MIKYRDKSSNSKWTNWRDFPCGEQLETIEDIEKYYRKNEKYWEIIVDLSHLLLVKGKLNDILQEYWDDSTPYEENTEEIPDWLK